MRSFRLRRSSSLSRLTVSALALSALLCDAGCGNNETSSTALETDETVYQNAKKLKADGHPDEALAAFESVIKKRPDDAPESHLEAGLILLNDKKDPYAAIYHFEKYLDAKPTPDEAPKVRELIDTAKKEIVRSLPGTPVGDYNRLDLLEKIKSQQAEIDRLQHGGLPTSQGTGPILATTMVDTTVAHTSVTTPDPAPPPIDHPTPTRTTVTTTTVTTPVPPKPGPTIPHTYTVKSGDSLSKISRTLYGSPNRTNDIFKANTDKMTSVDSPLHAGEILNLPQ